MNEQPPCQQREGVDFKSHVASRTSVNAYPFSLTATCESNKFNLFSSVFVKDMESFSPTNIGKVIIRKYCEGGLLGCANGLLRSVLGEFRQLLAQLCNQALDVFLLCILGPSVPPTLLTVEWIVTFPPFLKSSFCRCLCHNAEECLVESVAHFRAFVRIKALIILCINISCSRTRTGL